MVDKRKIYIVGGDGFARECYHHIQRMQEWDQSVTFAGFLGHGGYGHTVDYKTYQQYYLGEVSDHVFKEDECAVIGAGYPDLRRTIYYELKSRGIPFVNILTEPIRYAVNFGEANIIVGSSAMSTNITMGTGNVLNGDITVGHDVEMGDFNFYGPRSQLLGYVKIGSNNVVGAGSVILAHARIGDMNKVAPLSVVYRGCRSRCYMLGNPALKVGDIETANDII